jgi:hypothetical protein
MATESKPDQETILLACIRPRESVGVPAIVPNFYPVAVKPSAAKEPSINHQERSRNGQTGLFASLPTNLLAGASGLRKDQKRIETLNNCGLTARMVL